LPVARRPGPAEISFDDDYAIDKGREAMPFNTCDSVAPPPLMGGLRLDLPQPAAAAPFRSTGDYDGVRPDTGPPSDRHSR